MSTATMEAPGTNGAIATRRYQPLAPIGTAAALSSLLETQKDKLAQVLPRHVTPERLLKTLLVAANRTPDLLQCTQSSILETINRAAELGLDLSGTLGEAYPVPFNNKVRGPSGEQWVKQCQLIIGYRGFAKLARQTGEIKRIEADVVHERDEFDMRKGSDARCTFAPYLKGDRGQVIGAFAYVLFTDGGEQFDFMPVCDIEKVRQRSKSGSDKSGNAIGAWKSDWSEMAKKTVFRRVAKWLPLSTEKFTRAMEVDSEEHFTDVVEASTAAGAAARGVASLAARVTQRPVSEGQEFEPTPEAMADAAAEAEQDEHHQRDTGGQPTEDPDVSGADAEPPLPDLSTLEAWEEAMTGLMAGQLEPAAFSTGLGKIRINYALARRTEREKTYRAAAAGKMDWQSGKVAG
jgi:recombination protein RecT